MKRPLKISLVLTGVTAIGQVFWMRSLASWRPVKLGQVSPPLSVGFLSSDEQTALLRGDAMLYRTVLNLSSGKQTEWGESFSPAPHFSQKSPELAFVFDNVAGKAELRAREIRSGELKQTFVWPTLSKQEYPEILLDSDEKIVSAVDSPHFFQWHIENGKLLRQVNLEKPFKNEPSDTIRFSLSSDGTQLFGCAPGGGKIWQIPSGKLVRHWTKDAYEFSLVVSSEAHVAIYTYLSSTNVTPLFFVDASTGKLLWESGDDGADSGDDVGPSSIYNNEIYFLRKERCEIVDISTGRIKRHLAVPRQIDGKVVRVTNDYIYTQNKKGEIYRWRAR